MKIFVSVGNATQSFGRLLSGVSAASSSFPGEWIVQHGNTPFENPMMTCRPFLSMEEYTGLIAAADLVVTHAGAGAVINAIRHSKVPVVVPRQARFGEHIDDHQSEFASELSRTGKVVVCWEPGDLVSAMAKAIASQEAGSTSGAVPQLVSLVRACLESYASRSR